MNEFLKLALQRETEIHGKVLPDGWVCRYLGQTISERGGLVFVGDETSRSVFSMNEATRSTLVSLEHNNQIEGFILTHEENPLRSGLFTDDEEEEISHLYYSKFSDQHVETGFLVPFSMMWTGIQTDEDPRPGFLSIGTYELGEFGIDGSVYVEGDEGPRITISSEGGFRVLGCHYLDPLLIGVTRKSAELLGLAEKFPEYPVSYQDITGIPQE